MVVVPSRKKKGLHHQIKCHGSEQGTRDSPCTDKTDQHTVHGRVCLGWHPRSPAHKTRPPGELYLASGGSTQQIPDQYPRCCLFTSCSSADPARHSYSDLSYMHAVGRTNPHQNCYYMQCFRVKHHGFPTKQSMTGNGRLILNSQHSVFFRGGFLELHAVNSPAPPRVIQVAMVLGVERS